jgi:uracil-DNA glycosylase
MLQNLINENWLKLLEKEFTHDYFIHLLKFYQYEKNSFKVFPSENKIFAALNLTAFNDIKVVIIGQDPYHRLGQANGLCFSVSDGIKKPPSLLNIFKELKSDLDFPIPETGNLEPWAKQGVLLLNTSLTVREGEPGSHAKKGWEQFTDKIISIISNKKEGVIFLLWGNHAQEKEKLVDTTKHLVLKAAHPSPLARGAFFGCKHFSKTNSQLIQLGKKPINWQIKDDSLFD